MEGQIIHVKKCEPLAKPIYIENIYTPPKDNLEHYYEFINKFVPFLQKPEKNEVIFTGDFKLFKINRKYVISEYFNLLKFCLKITLIDNFLEF